MSHHSPFFVFLTISVALLCVDRADCADASPAEAATAESKYLDNGGDLFIGNYKFRDRITTQTDEADLRARQRIALGLAQFRAGKRTDALKTFQSALAFRPNAVVPMTMIAEITYADDPVRAEEILKRVAEIDDDYYRAHLIRAKFRGRNGDAEGMIESLNQCLQLMPNQMEARNLRGEALARKKGDLEALDQAIEDFQILKQVHPQQSHRWDYLIGQCYFNKGDFRHAARYFEPLASLPMAAEAAYLLGRCKQELGEFDEAVRFLSRSKRHHLRARDSTEKILQISLMQAESSTGEVRLKYLNNAYQELKVLLSLPAYSRQSDKFLTAGNIAFELGEYHDAVEFLKKYMELVPDAPDAKTKLLKSMLLSKNLSEAEEVEKLYQAYLASASATDNLSIRFDYVDFQITVRDWNRAEAELEKIREIAPLDGKPILLSAHVAFHQNRFEEAVELGRKALDLLPGKRDEIQVLLGKAHIQNSSSQEAAVAFRDAVDSAEENYKALRCLEIGEFYLDRGLDSAGLQYWEEALSYRPENDALRYEIGRAYLQNGSFELAYPFFEEVAKNSSVSENRSRAVTLLAYIDSVKGASEKSEERYREAIVIWSNNPFAHSGLAHLLADQERFEEARESFEMAVALQPGDATLLIQLGIVCDKLDDIECAEEVAGRAMEADPDHAERYNFLGYLYAERGIKLDEAVELVRKALDLQPNDPNITDSLGWAYYRMGEFDKAVDILEEAVSFLEGENEMGSSVIYEHLGDAYEKAGMMEKAIQMWRKAASGFPNSQTALEKLSSVPNTSTSVKTSETTQP